ncbi:MAG: DNA polymerase/3'-5' exonuclease PolX [Gammaproteobacteria bacterium]
MPIHNADIAAHFEEIAELLKIQGANPFRIRAYHNAARTISDLGTELTVMVGQGEDLTRLPGIGKDLAAKIVEIIQTGTTSKLKELHKSVPASVTDLLTLPGLGPKRVKTLMEQSRIRTLKQLLHAARAGKIRQLPGFGEKSEQQILQALEAHLGAELRFKLAVATQYADALLAHLRQARDVKDAVVAGSYRRAKETVGDLDILVSAGAESSVMKRFVSYDEVKKVVSQGTTRATVVLNSGLQVDLRVVPAESFGAALQYFTGSKAHNIVIRRLGQQRGLKINEYGVFKGAQRVAGATEQSVYAAVELPYIEPELRENRGEIEAAREHRLPKLIELKDLQGDLHSHTRATDGHNSLEEMARAAKKLGLHYLAVTEHSQRLTMTKGFDADRLARQMAEIDRLNAELEGICLLKGIEVDILEDGRLDLPDKILSRLDLVVGAVHSKFKLSGAKQTARILRAMDSPHFTILAHPSGRLLGERDAYDVDMERLIRAARQRGCFLELNAHPERLDLSDVYCNMAKSEGVLISIASDAHSVLDFANLRFAIGQARRGWLGATDVLNTRPLAKLRPLLRQTM